MAEPSMVPLAGSERTEQPGATLIGPVPDDELIEFAVVLRARPDAPDLAEVARSAAVTGEFLSRGEVTMAAAPDPADVTADVHDALDRYALVPENSDVIVEAMGNTVTLTGSVRTWAEHDAVIDAAWMARGVSYVRDFIDVSGLRPAPAAARGAWPTYASG